MSDCIEVTLLSSDGRRKAVFRVKSGSYGFDKEARRYSGYDLNTDRNITIYLGDNDSLITENISTERPLPVEKLGIQPVSK